MRCWTASVWGVDIALEWQDPNLDSHLDALRLPIWGSLKNSLSVVPFSVTPDETGTLRILGPDAESNIAPTSKLGLTEWLERRIHLYLATQCKLAVYVHAGVVEIAGRAVVFPGKSFTGKTTLVLKCLEAGLRVLSDEYAIVDTAGRVHAFPRPLSERLANGTVRRIPLPMPTHLDSSGLPLGAVVLCPYEQGAVWAPIPASSAEAVMGMLANTVSALAQPELAMTCLSQAVEGCIAWKSPRGQVEDSAPVIIRELRQLWNSGGS